MKLTPEYLEKLKRICYDTIDGPWFFDEAEALNQDGYTIKHKKPFPLGHVYDYGNITFICEAITAMPALIKAVEHYKELSEALSRDSDAIFLMGKEKLEAAEKEITRLKSLTTEIQSLRAKLEVAKDALEFYSPANEWDYGDKANKALAKINGDEK